MSAVDAAEADVHFAVYSALVCGQYRTQNARDLAGAALAAACRAIRANPDADPTSRSLASLALRPWEAQ